MAHERKYDFRKHLRLDGFDYRSNLGLNAGYTNTISNALLFDLRVAFSRFGEDRDPAQTFDPAKLGFSQTALGMIQLPNQGIGDIGLVLGADFFHSESARAGVRRFRLLARNGAERPLG